MTMEGDPKQGRIMPVEGAKPAEYYQLIADFAAIRRELNNLHQAPHKEEEKHQPDYLGYFWEQEILNTLVPIIESQYIAVTHPSIKSEYESHELKYKIARVMLENERSILSPLLEFDKAFLEYFNALYFNYLCTGDHPRYYDIIFKKLSYSESIALDKIRRLSAEESKIKELLECYEAEVQTPWSTINIIAEKFAIAFQKALADHVAKLTEKEPATKEVTPNYLLNAFLKLADLAGGNYHYLTTECPTEDIDPTILGLAEKAFLPDEAA